MDSESKISLEEEIYKNDYANAGKVLIFNQIIFKDPQIEILHCAKTDGENLKRVWKRYGCSVEYYENKDVEVIEDELKKGLLCIANLLNYDIS